MRMEHNAPLESLNTFGVTATARYLVHAASLDNMREALAWAGGRGVRVLVLGGGSNVLFTSDVDGLVLHVASKGVDFHHMGDGRFLLTVSAGESWPDLVWRAVENGLGGIENLCMIPGTVGGAAVQNAGAYGVEFRDVCRTVSALHRHTGETREFSVQECRFGYRDSFFKQHAEEWVITGVAIVLDRHAPLRTEYGALREILDARGITAPCFADIARAVACIREEKLPALEELGSAGSFFKNPVVPAEVYREMRRKNPDMPGIELPDGSFKLFAAWLLASAGWKGSRRGSVGCYPAQPLVLVNYGGAGGAEILEFSERIQGDVERRFGLRLDREVVVYP